METKFKVGDRVRVKSLEWYNNEPKDKHGDVRLSYGWEFIKDMVQYCGKVLKISRIYNDAYKVDDNPYHWQDWMLEDEPVAKEEQEVEQQNQNNMEARKMALKQAQTFLEDTKFICKSKEEKISVLSKLKELGVGIIDTKTDCAYMYTIDNDNYLRHTNSIENWIEENKKEISVSEILSIEIEKPKFDPNTLKPFDKVLVRDSKNEKWRARFFDLYEDGEFGTTCNCYWKNIIPYNKETKHLVGTADEAPDFYNIW